MKSEVLAVFHSDDFELVANVVVYGTRLFVDFYKGATLIETAEVSGNSIRYAEDMAENFVLGIIKLNDEKTGIL